jgi:Bacteriophage holin family
MKPILLKLALAALLVVAPIKVVLIAAMALTLIDLLSGLAAARHRGEPITSTGLKRTIVKILVYEFVILLGYLTEKYLVGDLLPVVKILTGYVGITELKSVLENVEEITGMDIIKLIINQLNPPQQ